jgi:hypothetical protein
MPASAGRTRMPHNNRVSTSGALATSDIWSKTIGHDPYANSTEERPQQPQHEQQNDKAKGLLELARHQKIAGDTTSRDDFARKLYLGLKGGKKRRADALDLPPHDGRFVEMLAQESSSEDEFVEEQLVAAKKKKAKHRHKSREQVSSEDGESSDDSTRERRRSNKRKKKKSKRASKTSRRRRSESSDDESSSDSEEERRRRKRRKRRKEERKHGKRRDDSRSDDTDDKAGERL